MCEAVVVIRTDVFDLPEWMNRIFPNLSLGGHLLEQWTVVLRFEIGFQHVYRAEQVFRAIWNAPPRIVLAGEDDSWEGNSSRWYPLFSLPDLLRTFPAPLIQVYNHVLSGGSQLIGSGVMCESAQTACQGNTNLRLSLRKRPRAASNCCFSCFTSLPAET